LQPLLGQLQGRVREIQDACAVANGQAWGTATALYSLLKRASRADPRLAAQLAPMVEFFAFRHPAVKEARAARKREREGAATSATQP
jgi:hypothetical protein